MSDTTAEILADFTEFRKRYEHQGRDPLIIGRASTALRQLSEREVNDEVRDAVMLITNQLQAVATFSH
jgi:hypothetical protein|tara:strand:- start:261 stop:464 length:204 start_codon:yes stop_codon:yes gene_type:complete